MSFVASNLSSRPDILHGYHTVMSSRANEIIDTAKGADFTSVEMAQLQVLFLLIQVVQPDLSFGVSEC